ncbi:MAG TPA: molybdenum cofactor guanylyltransferase MobA [Candidatus Thiothrix moscowensis]|uniref:molybdenum cofactor guanylyltransferase MobA n=1 Tax=unclassified Thiothrix TaxID=2636184 RepID=UPI0025EDC97D|nr:MULTISPECIES: molybdenum cofactor guanylyltransferase MobA [unclassified Thiothrix]HRJ52708.1 molybdenum cofactor guanylyltransferase MobA [Candidatus Thiothrix moscowensis]HRJ92808.1 molybdenum cofactor guanylyltransferase MobA [Candidatus Thiothrix moscowensis]
MTEHGEWRKGSTTAVVLAGGQGSRMGGQDKGLLLFHGRPLIEHVLDGLQAQVGKVLISANRHADSYRRYGMVIADVVEGFQGPLAGFAAALRVASTPYVLTVPCDAPNVPPQLAERLLTALQSEGAELAVAHDGFRLQPVYALLSQCLLDDLQAYLQQGGRSPHDWYKRHRMAVVDFSDCAAMFRNMNTPADKQMLEGRVPLLGFCAYSGTGKTTLLTQVIPLLKAAGLRIAVVKHTHHVIDLDQPGKDSYRMREAGAQQVVLASHQRIISLREVGHERQREASLADAISGILPENTDLILVEGFKHEPYPKIELHRPSVGKPLMFPTDGNIIAIATDDPALDVPPHLPKLDLNQPQTVADYILQRLHGKPT